MLQRTAVRTLTLGMQFCKTGMSSGKLELKEITLEKKNASKTSEWIYATVIYKPRKKRLVVDWPRVIPPLRLSNMLFETINNTAGQSRICEEGCKCQLSSNFGSRLVILLGVLFRACRQKMKLTLTRYSRWACRNKWLPHPISSPIAVG